MARFVQDLVLNKPDDFVYFIMNDYLQKNSFVMSDWKGEPAYRAGDAMVEGFKYLKWSYADGKFHLEAWLKGNLGQEWGLDGFVACLIKKPYRESLTQLLQVLTQPLPDSAQWQGAGEAQEGTPMPNVIPVQTVDNYKAAQQALVLGILSIPFGIFWPLIGVLLGAIGAGRARMGKGSSKGNLATAGKICSIVGMVLAFASLGLSIIINIFNIMLLTT